LILIVGGILYYIEKKKSEKVDVEEDPETVEEALQF
jgi:hypothetical protein